MDRKDRIDRIGRIGRIGTKVIIIGLIIYFGFFLDEKKDKTEIINNQFHIAIAYAVDNGYIYPTLVSMTSLAENAGNNTFYDIYVMISPNFLDKNQMILKTVEKNFSEHCSIYFINMEDRYKNLRTNFRLTTPAYYRLDLHILLPDVQRIIWMDGDAAVFEDLTELITLNMQGNYIMGFLDISTNAIEKFGIKDATVICSGVLLMDLEALRVNNMTEKIKSFISEERHKIDQEDQTIINVVCHGRIGVLPAKYGIWRFESLEKLEEYNSKQKPWLKYNDDEIKNAYYHPAILHYVWPKPYWIKKKLFFDQEWWDFANRSGYYNEVYEKSPRVPWNG